MGSWGVGPYENDDGADIKDIWEEYIPLDQAEWTEKKLFSFFKKVYFKGYLPVVSDGNSNDFIALGQLFYDHKLAIPQELKEKVSASITLEHSKDRLSEWGDLKRKRSAALKGIDKTLELEIDFKASRVKEKSKYTEEINSLKHWFENIERVNSLLDSMSIKTIDWMEEIKPDFIQSLEDQTWRFEDESDEDNAADLSNQRYKAVIWFALFNLKYEPSEIKKIIEEI